MIAASSSLANIAFGELRDRLQIHEIGSRSHEIHSSTRNILVGSLLVIYAFTFIEFNGQMLEKYDNLALKTIVSVRDGTNSEEEATRLFREEAKNIIPGVLSRPGFDIDSIPLPWNRLEDIEGKTSANSLTSNWHEIATSFGAKVEAVEGWAQAVALLEDGRIDLTINDKLTVLDYLKVQPNSAIKIVAESTDTSRNAFALTKGNEAPQADINQALVDLAADGTLAAIGDKYFGADVSK